MSGLPNKYGKYILIALILAIAAHSLAIYLFKVAAEFDSRIHELDRRLAVLENRKVGYLSMIDAVERERNVTTTK